MDNTRILVIDDEKGLRDMLVYSLTARGYGVETAAGGAEALELARGRRFDLALCDVMMPGMDGLQTLRLLKEARPELEVVMVTGYATLETAIRAMKEGAYDYVSKPYELDELCGILDKALERGRLKAKVGELEQLSRLKSEFLANMSHELRTPLNAILGYSSLLMDGIYGEVPAAQGAALQRVVVNSRNLLALINNILDFSKLNAGMMPLHIEEFDALEIAREVADTMQCLAEQKKLSLEVRGEGPLPVRSDKTKVKQILINLAGNAIKFTETGSVVISAEALPGAAGLSLSVSDTGPGIAAADVPAVFQEFKQLDGAATRRFGGTGLGLSITKKLAELLGGSVAVESEPGRGSTFRVTLDRALLPEDPLDAGSAEPGPALRTVLAIDDDPEVLRLLRDSLKGTGYGLVAAASGEEGLALARTRKPFVITLDVMMPHRDGWSVLQALKRDPELRDIPVIMASILENRALGFSLGVADYMVKPFDRATLLDKLKGVESAAGRRVLVVDDDEDVRGMVQLGLKYEGYRVETAADGRSALAAIAAAPPDVLFLDLNLPDMSGLELLGRLDAASRNMRVIVLTGQPLDAEQRRGLLGRAARVIDKGAMSLSAVLDSINERAAAPAGAP
jgi:DNA-binding response OmpR family regulator